MTINIVMKNVSKIFSWIFNKKNAHIYATTTMTIIKKILLIKVVSNSGIVKIKCCM